MTHYHLLQSLTSFPYLYIHKPVNSDIIHSIHSVYSTDSHSLSGFLINVSLSSPQSCMFFFRLRFHPTRSFLTARPDSFLFNTECALVRPPSPFSITPSCWPCATTCLFPYPSLLFSSTSHSFSFYPCSSFFPFTLYFSFSSHFFDLFPFFPLPFCFFLSCLFFFSCRSLCFSVCSSQKCSFTIVGSLSLSTYIYISRLSHMPGGRLLASLAPRPQKRPPWPQDTLGPIPHNLCYSSG